MQKVTTLPMPPVFRNWRVIKSLVPRSQKFKIAVLTFVDQTAGKAKIVEDPVAVDYRGYTVYKCGPWTQGPALCQALRLLEGFDLKGIIRALWSDLRHMEMKQGASTLTQQLARDYFLTREQLFTRKLREAFLAYKIEQEFTKEQIMALFLNKMFFGQRAYGVAAAARVYFNGGGPVTKNGRSPRSEDSTLRMNVLVNAKQVVGVIFRLDLRKAIVVVTVAGLHPFLPFLHHEVDVRTAARVRVHGVPIADGPVAKNVLLGWIRIDADDDAGPVGVAVAPGGLVRHHPVGRPVDGVDVHRREHRR